MKRRLLGRPCEHGFRGACSVCDGAGQIPWEAEDHEPTVDPEITRIRDINADLLAALEGMVESYEHEAAMDNPALLQARATIKKARQAP